MTPREPMPPALILMSQTTMTPSTPPDRLDALLRRFSLRTSLFHAGPLCGINDIGATAGVGHLHVIRAGEVEVLHGNLPPMTITEPTLLFYPRAVAHRFVSDAQAGADMVCASTHFGGGDDNPLVRALPAVLALPLREHEAISATLDLLVDEAFGGRCGGRIAVDRLFEVLLIQLLRELMQQGRVQDGMLAGLAHPQLRHALIAMHEAPQEAHGLESLAARAHMSRTRFAQAFRELVGQTPLDYLAAWRMAVAQDLLQRDHSLAQIAEQVGYGSAIAFNRAFKSRMGVAPGAWRRQLLADVAQSRQGH